MNKLIKLELNVIRALFYREIQTRFYSKKLGFFWTLFDIIILILVFSLLRSLMGGNQFSNLDYTVFLTIGLLSFFLWRNIVKKSMEAFDSNKALFVYNRVRPYHTVISRTFIEVIIFFSVFALLFFVGFLFDKEIIPDSWFNVILSFFWLIIFGLSIGFISAIFSDMFSIYKHIFNALLIPLIFISAIMYTVDSLPIDLREIILLNPLTHFMELIHASYFKSLNTSYVNYNYMFLWTFIPFVFGLLLYRVNEERIISN